MKKVTRTVSIHLVAPATLVASSTQGHSHLYLDLPLAWTDAKRVLGVLGDVGVLERGFVRASLRRGHASVRLPWVRKPALPGGIERYQVAERSEPLVVPGGQPRVMMRSQTLTLSNNYDTWEEEEIVETTSPHEAHLVTSRLRGDARHALVLDIDGPSTLTGAAEDGSLVWQVETLASKRDLRRMSAVLAELGVATRVLVHEPDEAGAEVVVPVTADADEPHPEWTSWGWFRTGRAVVVDPSAPQWCSKVGRRLDHWTSPAAVGLVWLLVGLSILFGAPFFSALVILLVSLSVVGAMVRMGRATTTVRAPGHVAALHLLHEALGHIHAQERSGRIDADQIMWEAAGGLSTTQALLHDAERMRAALRSADEVESQIEARLNLELGVASALSLAADEAEAEVAARRLVLGEMAQTEPKV